MILSRRKFLRGLGAALAAPVIVRAASLMPIKAPPIQLAPSPGYASLYEELTDITRKAFVPRVYIQIYRADPLMQFILANAKNSDGVLFQS